MREKYLDAVRLGRIEQVAALLDAGQDVDAKDAWSEEYAITHAAALGYEKIVRLLWDRGASEDARAQAFIHAVNYLRHSIIELFIERGHDVNALGPSVLPPLWGAGWNGDTELVSRLARAGANPSWAGEGTGETPLIAAVQAGYYDVVKALVEVGADVNAEAIAWPSFNSYYPYTALGEALEAERGDIAVLLQEHGAALTCHADSKELENSSRLPRVFERYQQDVETWREKVDRARRGGDLDALRSALMEAFRRHLRPVVEPLENILEGLKPSQSMLNCWLRAAIRANYASLARWLVERGADVNAAGRKGETPLAAAVGKGNYALAGWLFDHGADPDWSGSAQQSERELEKSSSIGVSSGARLNIQQQGEEEPVEPMEPVSLGIHPLERLKIHAPAPPASVPDLRLHSAVGNLTTLWWLLGQGCPVQALDDQGRTPLHLADNEAEGRAFLRQGADVDARDAQDAPPC